MISRVRTRKIGLILGPIIFFVILFLPINGNENIDSESDQPPNNNDKGTHLSFSAQLVLASTFWMAIWWLTEAIPIYVTALLPLIIFPSLAITTLGDTAASYADRIIFLFLGGFMLAKAVEKTHLHKRFALNILNVFGTSPKYVVAAFMIVTGILSGWMSNTATTMLMLPIAAAVVSQIGIKGKKVNYKVEDKTPDQGQDKIENDNSEEESRFGLCLMLSIAYSASIGGMATLIGTPPNAIFASLSKSMLDIDISFGQWLLIGIPISVLSLIVAWFYMVHLGVKITDIKSMEGGKKIIKTKLEEIGKISIDEKMVAAVFIVTALAWITRGLFWGDLFPMIDDSTIAIAAAISLFLIPSRSSSSKVSIGIEKDTLNIESRDNDKKNNNGNLNNKNFRNKNIKEENKIMPRILDWESAVSIPWGVLILIGGGLALANAFTTTGLDTWISNQLVFVENLSYILIVFVIIVIAVIFGEIISNTATAALLIPISISLATTISLDPLLLMIPLTIATSYGFIMPIGTPPNAIVFGSKYVTAPKMAKAGFPLDLIGIVMVTALSTLMVPLIFS